MNEIGWGKRGKEGGCFCPVVVPGNYCMYDDRTTSGDFLHPTLGADPTYIRSTYIHTYIHHIHKCTGVTSVLGGTRFLIFSPPPPPPPAVPLPPSHTSISLSHSINIPGAGNNEHLPSCSLRRFGPRATRRELSFLRHFARFSTTNFTYPPTHSVMQHSFHPSPLSPDAIETPRRWRGGRLVSAPICLPEADPPRPGPLRHPSPREEAL
jgi:hypothetical protein